MTNSPFIPRLFNTWLIWVPEPGEYPVTLAELGVHVQENVAPATCEVRVRLVLLPEQMSRESGLFERSGIGLTNTV